MADSSESTKLSDTERGILDRLQTSRGVNYDFDEVSHHLSAFCRGDESANFAELPHMEPEKRAAAFLAQLPDDADLSEQSQDQLTISRIYAAYIQIVSGIDLVEWLGSYRVYEPSIEKIFELDRDESREAFDLFWDFTVSEHGAALNQFREPFLMGLREWDSEAETAESISNGLEIYRKVLGVFERGFPLLLGLKRILDGENPDVSELQRMRASSVRAELIDTDNHPNSVYFDLVVDQYNRRLRNALSHGDIVHDPSESQVKIPSEDIAYTYSEFNDIAKRNFANGVFLTGLCSSLIEWRVYMYENEPVTREMLPV